MKIKIIRIFILTIFFALIAGIAGTAGNSTGGAMILCIASGIVSATTASLYEFIDTHGKGFKIWFQSQFCYQNESLYLSFSYLFRINVAGKYLLIRGKRLKDRYQPIGGVYKFYDEAKPFLESIKYVPGTDVVNNDETDDLRIRISGHYLLQFYDWFLSMKDREYDPQREFYEEMQEFINKNGESNGENNSFKHLKYRKVDIHDVGITKSIIPNKGYEVIYADIFEIALDDEQKEVIKKAVEENPGKLCLVTAEEIKYRKRNGHTEMDIANNAPWTLGY